MTTHIPTAPLSRKEFLALDPTLSLLHANGLIESLLDGGWGFRVEPDGDLHWAIYRSAGAAAYARYLAIYLATARWA